MAKEIVTGLEEFVDTVPELSKDLSVLLKTFGKHIEELQIMAGILCGNTDKLEAEIKLLKESINEA